MRRLSPWPDSVQDTAAIETFRRSAISLSEDLITFSLISPTDYRGKENMKYNLFLHISSSNIVSISFSRQRYKKFRVNEVKEDEFFFAKHKDFLNQFNYRMYITPELQSGYIPLFSLLLLTLNRAYTIEYGPHSICRKERFRPQPPRGVWLDGPGRPNRRLGPSNRPPRAFFLFHPAPSPSGVGSSSLFTRLRLPPESAPHSFSPGSPFRTFPFCPS